MHFELRAITQFFSRWSLRGVLVLFLLAGLLMTMAAQILRLSEFDEVGYGDSYILYDVLHFRATGQIYRDLSEPPYSAAQYSPLVYRLYAIPPPNISGNPFLGPRLMALAAFLLCLGIAGSLASALIPVHFAWLVGLLLAASITPMESWVLQIRGDFPAIFFSLSAIRLLMLPSPLMVVLAGLCAGFATQFKFVYVAALLAGSMWLVWQKKWKELALFAAAGALSSVGLYLAFWLREPRMLDQLLALSPGVRDVWGCLRLIADLSNAPVILFALPALHAVISRAWPRWRLVLLFTVVSFSIGSIVDIQAGGSYNYFFEGLFSLVPFAAFGCLRLLGWSRRNTGLSLFLTGLVLFQFFLPEVQYFRHNITSRQTLASINHDFHALESALSGLHILSTVPRLALLDSHPALTEPYLFSYSRRINKGNTEPVFDSVRRGEFDVAITSAYDLSWRGVPHLDPALRRTLMAAYRPYCEILNDIIYLPLARLQDSALKLRFSHIGCQTYPRSPPFP